ncbi:transposable element Tcb2 transposase [Trichonephila clavipes]|nr:transposable element Tcb2 transposase [Trichonephila clavipes]
MDDNCRPHRANLVEDFLFEEGIIRMEWPVSSPYMNPIEHVWDALGRRVAGHQPPPQTLQELEECFSKLTSVFQLWLLILTFNSSQLDVSSPLLVSPDIKLKEILCFIAKCGIHAPFGWLADDSRVREGRRPFDKNWPLSSGQGDSAVNWVASWNGRARVHREIRRWGAGLRMYPGP